MLGVLGIGGASCNPSGDSHAPAPARAGAPVSATPASAFAAEAAEAPPVPAAPATGAADPICASVCARSAPLRCPGSADCERQCEAMRALPRCRAEMNLALHCFASVPLAQWECTDDGAPSVRPGQCDAEQARVAGCLASTRQ